MGIRLLIKKTNAKEWTKLAFRSYDDKDTMKEIEEIRDGWMIRGGDEYKTAKYLIQKCWEHEPFPTDEDESDVKN